jgi:hypothetical protein
MSLSLITKEHTVKPRGKYVTYIKSGKEKERGRHLINLVLGAGTTHIDEFIETKGRKNFKPELEKAIQKCNERSAKLLIPNIGHLPRNLTACSHFMKLDNSQEVQVFGIIEIREYTAVFGYGVLQMHLQCLDQIKSVSKKARAGLYKKMNEIDPNTGKNWKAGNKVNLSYATLRASKKRSALADAYVESIIGEIREIQRFGKTTLQQIADALIARGHRTRRGKNTWTPTGVSNVIKKANKLGI